jgi:Ca2+-binding RTX toxin-like protein
MRTTPAGGGFDYTATYRIGGPPVPIADIDDLITDPDSTTMSSARISLVANGQVPPNDILSINGTLPAGITASAYNPSTGVLTLTGIASIAAYQTALRQVVLSTTDPFFNADRIVSVTVNDESNHTSNVAQAFVHVAGSRDVEVGVQGTENWMSSDPAQQTAATPGFPDGYPLYVKVPVSPLGLNVHVESAGTIPNGVFYFDGTDFVALTPGVILYDPSLNINLLDDLVYRPTATPDDTVDVNLSLDVSDGVFLVSQNVAIHERPPASLPSESVTIGDGGGPLNSGNDITGTFELSQVTVAGILVNPHGATIAVSTDFQHSPFDVPVPPDEQDPTTFGADDAGSHRESELQVELQIGGNSFAIVQADLTALTFEQSWFFDPVTGLMKATVDYDHIFLLDGSGNATTTTLADYLIANPPSAGDTWTVVYADNDGGLYEARQAQLDFSVDNPDDPSIFVFGDTTLPDRINGTSGNDTLFGNGGDDIIIGRDGNDILGGGAGNDVLDGGADIDTATYVTATSGVTVDLNILTPQDTGGAGTDTLTSIENIFGSTFSDALIGDANANSLFGAEGDDTLTGGLGSDRLSGGAGADHFVYTSTADGGTIADQTDADRIATFDLVEGDSIDVLASAFGGGLVAGTDATGIFGSSADDTFASPSERFHFNTSTQTLLYDSNGSDPAGTQVALAVLANGGPVDAAHIHMV